MCPIPHALNSEENAHWLILFATNRGKMVGGSTGLNYLTWDRATKREYDAWSEFSDSDDEGGVRWDYESLFPYFKRTEAYIGETHDPITLSEFEEESLKKNAEGTKFGTGYAGRIEVSFVHKMRSHSQIRSDLELDWVLHVPE